MIAAFVDRPAALRCLLRAGADTKLRTVAGRTALQIAKDEGNTECVRTLEEHAAAENAERFRAARAASKRPPPSAYTITTGSPSPKPSSAVTAALLRSKKRKTPGPGTGGSIGRLPPALGDAGGFAMGVARLAAR